MDQSPVSDLLCGALGPAAPALPACVLGYLVCVALAALCCAVMELPVFNLKGSRWLTC